MFKESLAGQTHSRKEALLKLLEAKHAQDIDNAVMYAVQGERKRIGEEVEKMRKEYPPIGIMSRETIATQIQGYNQALDDIKNIFK